MKLFVDFMGENYIEFVIGNDSNLNPKSEINKIQMLDNEEDSLLRDIILKDIIKEMSRIPDHKENALYLAKSITYNKKAKGSTFKCPKCQEELLICSKDKNSICYYCGYEEDYEKTLKDYFNNFIDGSDYIVYDCDYCEKKAILRDKDESYKCFSCGVCMQEYSFKEE
ncbi:hypothetical protein [Clostridioides difficile]|uniref:hypothetical protein n=1 Tax=Clostridioides difficile TaxID=1496 RepID=UPI001041B879|nr:hypothetical protein [Clostridioides difficile]